MSRPRCRLLVPALLPLQVALAACGGSEDRSRLEALAGTYGYEENKQAGPGGQLIHERVALTLRADSRWTMLRAATVDGAPFVSSSDSGTYTLKGNTLVTYAPTSGGFQYRVSGDTLWMDATAAAAATKAVTSMDVNVGAGYLVRER